MQPDAMAEDRKFRSFVARRRDWNRVKDLGEMLKWRRLEFDTETTSVMDAFVFT